MLNGLVYETLLGLHPTTLEYIPALATHWQISPDKMTFRFRIDPNARWSDGMPVTADDVVATWKLMVDKSLQDPARTLVFANFEQPVAESKYIVSRESQDRELAELPVLLGHVHLPGARAQERQRRGLHSRLQLQDAAGHRPLHRVGARTWSKGKSITIRRRKDYWAEKQRRNVGINNFDEIHQIVVRDRNLEFEMFKKGDSTTTSCNARRCGSRS